MDFLNFLFEQQSDNEIKQFHELYCLRCCRWCSFLDNVDLLTAQKKSYDIIIYFQFVWWQFDVVKSATFTCIGSSHICEWALLHLWKKVSYKCIYCCTQFAHLKPLFLKYEVILFRSCRVQWDQLTTSSNTHFNVSAFKWMLERG